MLSSLDIIIIIIIIIIIKKRTMVFHTESKKNKKKHLTYRFFETLTTISGIVDIDEPRRHEKTYDIVSNRFDTNRVVQAQKMARDRKFWIEKEEKLYYPCSESIGADQLRSYFEADLRLCIRICEIFVFL